tara:strand:- start:2648 stop:2878 length:231 start_codon:yes stop_codon:yes gene_type:complete
VDALNTEEVAVLEVEVLQPLQVVVQYSEVEEEAAAATQEEHQEVTTSVLVGQMAQKEPVENLVVVTVEAVVRQQEA